MTETHQILFEFQETRWVSRSKSRSRSQDVSSLVLYRRRIPNLNRGVEGQSSNILTSWTGLWARCSMSFLEFEKYLMCLLAETKHRVIPATKFKLIIYLLIYLFNLFLFIHLFIYLFICYFHNNKNTCGSLSISSSRGGRRLPLWSVWWLVWWKRKTFVNCYSLILYQSNW